MPAMRASYPRPREPTPNGTPEGMRAYLLALGRRRLRTLGRFGRGQTPAVRAFTRASPADCDLAGVDPGTATDRTRGAGPGRRKGLWCGDLRGSGYAASEACRTSGCVEWLLLSAKESASALIRFLPCL